MDRKGKRKKEEKRKLKKKKKKGSIEDHREGWRRLYLKSAGRREVRRAHGGRGDHEEEEERIYPRAKIDVCSRSSGLEAAV